MYIIKDSVIIIIMIIILLLLLLPLLLPLLTIIIIIIDIVITLIALARTHRHLDSILKVVNAAVKPWEHAAHSSGTLCITVVHGSSTFRNSEKKLMSS